MWYRNLVTSENLILIFQAGLRGTHQNDGARGIMYKPKLLRIMPYIKLARRKKTLYQRRAAILKALAHPIHLLIVDDLSHGERYVRELTDMIEGDYQNPA